MAAMLAYQQALTSLQWSHGEAARFYVFDSTGQRDEVLQQARLTISPTTGREDNGSAGHTKLFPGMGRRATVWTAPRHARKE